MINTIHCKVKKRSNKCLQKNIISLQNRREVLQNDIADLEVEVKLLEQELLNCSSVADYLQVKERLDNSPLIEHSHTTFTCCSNPFNCKQEYNNLYTGNISNKIIKDELLYSVNYIYRILNQVDEYLSATLNNDHIYIRFKLDKKDKLVCFYMDYNSIYKRETIFFLFGINGLTNFLKEPYQGNTYIDLRLKTNFDNYTSSFEINPIRVPKSVLRIRHGSMALNALVEATKQINSELKLLKPNPNDPYFTAPISNLEGSICPLGNRLSYKELCNFYIKNNYTTSSDIPYIKVCINN